MFSVLVPHTASSVLNSLGNAAVLGQETLGLVKKNFLACFKVKGILQKGHCLWPVEGVGFEGQGKSSYLVFSVGAKPGGFSLYLPWKERDLEAVSSLLWGMVIFSCPD